MGNLFSGQSKGLTQEAVTSFDAEADNTRITEDAKPQAVRMVRGVAQQRQAEEQDQMARVVAQPHYYNAAHKLHIGVDRYSLRGGKTKRRINKKNALRNNVRERRHTQRPQKNAGGRRPRKAQGHINELLKGELEIVKGTTIVFIVDVLAFQIGIDGGLVHHIVFHRF
jgi:hypothetical protein